MQADSHAPRTPASGVRAVLVAAGRATRMGGGPGPRKPLIKLHGRPILEHTAAAFQAAPSITSIVIVCHPDDIDTIRDFHGTSLAFQKLCAVIRGGKQRADSVRLGCAELLGPWLQPEPEVGYVAIHDAARPLIQAADIERVVAAAKAQGAALLALPVRDTLKRSSDGQRAQATVEREGLWAAQTPQVFGVALLRHYQQQALEEDFQGTDDAALFERYGEAPQLVAGSLENLKITERADLALGEALLAARHVKTNQP